MDWIRHLDELLPEEVDALWELWQVDPWSDHREDMRFRMLAQLQSSGELPVEVSNYLRLPELEDIPTTEATRDALRRSAP